MPKIHAFEVDDDDHCETPACAYDDIVPVLHWLAAQLGKTPEDLKIYDPYFCAGAVVRNLTERGFPHVYNQNEDFYAKIASKTTPQYDVLVTNPPYSEDHIERMLRFCTQSGKPWLALVPNYVYTHAYYSQALSGEEEAERPAKKKFDAGALHSWERSKQAAGAKPFYIVPPKRYTYYVPGGVRSKREVPTSPFLSFWYCGLGQLTAPFIKWWRKAELGDDREAAAVKKKKEAVAASGLQLPPGTILVGQTSKLPHRMRAQYDKTRKRLRKKQRATNDRRKWVKKQENFKALRKIKLKQWGQWK